MRQHQYYTSYAQQLLQEKKAENLKKLEKKEREAVQIIPSEENSSKKTKNKGNKRPERGIETMFRITSANNQRLSDMADNKANILITVNSIILSMVIALLLRKLDENEHLMIPTFLLLCVSLSTMVTAILSTRPRIPSGYFSAQEIKDKSVNLLFFGNFFRMKLEDYAYGMEKVMADRDFLYGMLTKDVYSQGVVLGRKYRFLRLSYNIFMFGLIASVLAFLISIILL